MNRLVKALLAASVGALLGGMPAFADICAGGFSLTESNHTVFEHSCYAYYFNNSGATRTSGEVVILDVTGTGVNQPSGLPGSGSRGAMADVDGSDGDVTNIGTYVTVTTTVDSPLVVGVVDDDSCIDQTYCRVQTYGPRLVLCADSTDAVATSTTVSTSATSGQCGDAANDADGILGISMEDGDGPATDKKLIWIFIRPSWTDG